MIDQLLYKESIVFPRIRYYSVGEYGDESWRPHYHAIAFNIPKEVLEDLQTIWKHGFVKIGTVTPGSIKYVTKYVTKVDSRDLDLRDLPKPFNAMSKGIGENYVTDETKEYHSRTETKLHIVKDYVRRLPTYYHSRIHNLEDAETAFTILQYKKTRQREAKKAMEKKIDEILARGEHVYTILRAEERNELIKYKLNNKRNKL